MSTTSDRVGDLHMGLMPDMVFQVWQTPYIGHPPFPRMATSMRGKDG